MKTGLTIEKVSFYTDEERGFCACTISAHLRPCAAALVKTTDNKPVRIKVTGKSQCNTGDAYDMVLGKRVAESRAKSKLFNQAYAVFAEEVAKRQKELDMLVHYMNNDEFLSDKELAHVNDLIDNAY